MDPKQQPCLPSSGRINCTLCHGRPIVFDETRTSRDEPNWRLTANPLAWGNDRPEVLVLGFSKGPSQAGELRHLSHNDIPFRKGRLNVGKILAHVGLLSQAPPEQLKRAVEAAVTDRTGRFGWGSLIRCTVERFDNAKNKWVGSGGMIDPFMQSRFGQNVSTTCATRFLRDLPAETKLVVLFGLGARGSYVSAARKIIATARPGAWRTVNEVAYTDGRITIVHVEHFASQGALLPNWLGQNRHERARLGLLARQAVASAVEV